MSTTSSRLFGAEREAWVRGAGARQEERDGAGLARVLHGFIQRDLQRAQPINLLLRHLERLLAGRQDGDARRPAAQRGRKLGGGAGQVLAVVEQKQHALGTQSLGQGSVGLIVASKDHAKHARDGAWGRAKPWHRSQVRQPYAIGVIAAQLMGHGLGQRCLADSARTRHRDEPGALDQRTQRAHVLLAAVQRGQLGRQVGRELGGCLGLRGQAMKVRPRSKSDGVSSTSFSSAVNR